MYLIHIFSKPNHNIQGFDSSKKIADQMMNEFVVCCSADGNYEVRYKSNVLIYPDGEVLWIPPAIYQVNLSGAIYQVFTFTAIYQLIRRCRLHHSCRRLIVIAIVLIRIVVITILFFIIIVFIISYHVFEDLV